MKVITVYSRKGCIYCLRARQLLQTNGLEFREVDLGGQPDILQALKNRTGHPTLPQIFIGEEFIGGYTELAGLKRSGQLLEMIR